MRRCKTPHGSLAPQPAQLTVIRNACVLTETTKTDMSDLAMDFPVLTMDQVRDEASDDDKRLVAMAKVVKMVPQDKNVAEYRSDVATTLAFELMEHPRSSLGDDATEVGWFLRIVPMQGVGT